MDKTNDTQLELFSQSKDSWALDKHTNSNSFKAFIWHYEKTILFIIAFTITSIVSFSLGVKKGKAISLSKSVSLPQATYDNINRPESKTAVIEENVLRQAPTGDSIQGFAIQLASFKTKTLAQKEAQVLERKGFVPLILSKGKFTVLCVGAFSKKEEAQSLLSELRKRYDDCFIRRL